MTVTPRIEYLPLDSLRADPRNPKSHDLDLIDASMERFGVIEHPTIDGRTGMLIAGHGRVRSLRERKSQGDAPPDGVRIDPKSKDWLVPVNSGWSSRNDTEAAAALIALNRTTELGGWKDQQLFDLLTELSDSEDGFEGVGFSDTDLADLEAKLTAVLDDLEEDDSERGSGSGSRAVTIKLTDPGLIARWHDIRDTYKTDDDAVRALLAAAEGGTGVPQGSKKPRRRRGSSAAAAGSGSGWAPQALIPAESADDGDDLVIDLSDLPDER